MLKRAARILPIVRSQIRFGVSCDSVFSSDFEIRQDLCSFSEKVSRSPFRLRLRIALTPAVAIEGEGGRGAPPFVDPERSFLEA